MQKIFADSKSRAQELSNDVSFVIFGHQTWDLERGGKLTPPRISWFSSTPAEIGLRTHSPIEIATQVISPLVLFQRVPKVDFKLDLWV